MSWWEPIAQIGGSLLSGILDNESADDQADALRKGNEQALGYAKDVYKDQRALALPGYMTGGAAMNKLGSMYHIVPQDYGAAARGDPTSSSGSSNYDWNGYFNENLSDPGIAQAGNWATNAKLREMFGNDKTKYAQHHYENFGKGEGRTLNTIGGGAYQPATGGTPNALAPTGFDMNEFWNSPEGKLATENFMGVVNPAVKGAFATAGKAASGAQQKALFDRGKATAGGAFGDYKSGLQSLAGLATTGANALGASAQNFGSTAGALARNTGQIQADKTMALNNNWKTGLNNAMSGWV